MTASVRKQIKSLTKSKIAQFIKGWSVENYKNIYSSYYSLEQYCNDLNCNIIYGSENRNNKKFRIYFQIYRIKHQKEE